MPSKKRKALRIALGIPEWEPFYQVMSGKPADATYVIQGNLAKGLAARGHSLTFIAPKSPEEFIVTDNPLDANIYERTWSAGNLFDYTSKIIWRIQKLLGIPYLNFFSNYRYFDVALQALKDVDVVYERNALYNVGLAMAAKWLQCPYVVFFEADQLMELDIMGEPVEGVLRWRAKQLLRYNLSVANCIVCVTDVGRRHLIENWQIPADKIVVLPNAVHVNIFRPDEEARMQVRKTLGMTDEPVVIFVGNFYHWHDVDTLLKAFARTIVTHPHARLVLVGDGERKPEMMKQVSRLGLGHLVHFIGIVPHADVPRYVSASDIAVVPYPPMNQEMWLSPLKLFEYMAAGKAIVASEVGQIVDVLEDGQNGLLVPPGDEAALANALVKLLDDSLLRSKLEDNARSDAVQKYSWESYLSRLEQVMRNAIDMN